MCSSLNTIEQIIADTPKVNNILIDAQKYYAHINLKKPPETLDQHVKLVISYYLLLCKEHHLDVVIDNMILDFVNLNFHFQCQIKAGNFIKKLFVNIIVFHDYGKINENFQAHPDKMNNQNFQEIESQLSTYHSSLSAYLFIVKNFQEFYNNKSFTPKEHLPLSLCVLVFSYPIFKHHSKFLNDKINDEIFFSETDIDIMINYISKYQFIMQENFSLIIPANIGKIFKLVDTEKITFSLYSLIKLSFSLLTASDYLATNEYMNDMQIEHFGTLSRERIDAIYENVQNIKDYNKFTYQKLDNYKFQRPTLVSNENLNILRQEMAIEVIQNIRQNTDKNLFYIEAPTGGGKTNLSMLAIAELLKSNTTLNKIFYVFPFTTLITQTHKTIIETLGLNLDEVVQLHSKAGFQTKEEKEDGFYGEQKLNYIDNLFVNFPFCLLTHIKFFDILKSNNKETNYLLHRLANSVVVIDELQSYNPSHWDKVIYFIRNYAQFYNIKFILMSATLPKLDKLKILKGQVNNFVYLLRNAKKDYFQNPNFANRVSFKFELLDKNNIQLEELASILLEKSKIYSECDFGESKPKGSIYTIIEFIFKKTASEFYQIIQKNNDLFDEIFVLSGTILEHRRKYIINYLKNIENRKKRILLITTQVVEAGVDIDMDLGFKNISLIDSDEQLAGRINRNVNKQNCELYIFQFNEPLKLYNKDLRYKKTKENFNQGDYQEILLSKDFDLLYNLVLANIDEWNDKPMAIGFNEYLNEIKMLNFRSVSDKFKLIEQENISVFVPLAVPAVVNGIAPNNNDMIFSKKELQFLANANIYPNKDNKIEGEKVFGLYIDVIHNRKSDFIEQKVSFKILSGIMSKFVFSIFSNPNDRAILYKYSEADKNEFGYIYLSSYKSIYNENMGLNLNSNDSVII